MNMFSNARKDDYPFLADWFAICLRWMVLLGAANALLIAGSFNRLASATMLICALWNVLISLLAILNRRLPWHREVNMGVDFLLSTALFILGGGIAGPLSWVGLLAIFSAAIYFEWRGALFTAMLVQIFITIWVLALGAGGFNLVLLLPLAVFYLLTAGVFGLLSRQLMRGIRGNYQAVISKRSEGEIHLQRSERERLRTFYRLVETISGTLNYRVVLESALELSHQALGEAPDVDQMISAVLLFGEHGLDIGSARGLPLEDMNICLPADAGALAEVSRTGLPVQAQNPASDPELKQLLGLRACASGLILPLNRGLNSYGVMLFAHPSRDFFDNERTELLEMISHQSVITIQNALLFQDLEQEKARILSSQEEARKKLARELHDGPAQSVGGIATRISIARRLLEHKPEEAVQELIKVEDLARRTTREIRGMLFTLRPLALEMDGLEAALQAMAENMCNTYQQNLVLDLDSAVIARLETSKQTIVFYLVDEATNNARKHASALEIRVSLHYSPDDAAMALLEVTDDGTGFDVKGVHQSYDRRGSLGMVNLRERTEMLSGYLHIESAPGKGTRVQVTIPLDAAAAERLQRNPQHR